MNLSIWMTRSVECLAGCFPAHFPICQLYEPVCLSCFTRPCLCLWKFVCYMQTFSPFFHFFSFFCLSLYISVIRLVPFILWSFIPSLKHFKLWWWLANLSQISLMGSACTHSPHGRDFTAVLLIYSWKTTIRCPSFKTGKGLSLLSNPFFHLF